jgi:3-phenylpropionate/cinnamic acid dioxygenase small subunit
MGIYMETVIKQKISCEIYLEIVNFLNKEAELLDNFKYKDWLNLVTDDIEYIFYSRQNIEAGSPQKQLGSPIIMDNKILLEKRINRLYSEFAWAELPRSMSRHFITNIRVYPTEKENEVKVVSNVLFYRHRHDNLYHELISYERHDILRKVNGEWKIAKREIIPDTNIILVDHLANIY